MKSLYRLNRTRCFLSLANSIAVVLIVFAGLVMRGKIRLQYFTSWANILCALSAVLSIPYAVDGIRKHNFHLPNWIVDVLYCGVAGTSIVFFVVVFLFAPFVGFDKVFASCDLLYHGVSPLLSLLLFTVINNDHRISFRVSLVTMIPFLIYFILYYVEVGVIGEANGGWADEYSMSRFAPWLIALVLFPLALGITNLVRLLHNAVYESNKKRLLEYYGECEEFRMHSIREPIGKLAHEDAEDDRGGDVVVPRRLIRMMMDRYRCSETMEELCGVYLKNYFESTAGKPDRAAESPHQL